jgi:hypothetical protein
MLGPAALVLQKLLCCDERRILRQCKHEPGQFVLDFYCHFVFENTVSP